MDTLNSEKSPCLYSYFSFVSVSKHNNRFRLVNNGMKLNQYHHRFCHGLVGFCALINTKGQVVGINSLKISEAGVEGLGFAIPSNDFLPIVKEIIEKGQVQRPYIGVGLVNLEEIPQYYLKGLPDQVQHGAVITNVVPNSPAGKAGLQMKDVIVEINGKEVQGVSDFRKYLYTKIKIGDEVKLGIYRQGKFMTLNLTLTRAINS
jgi:serine protease Do